MKIEGLKRKEPNSRHYFAYRLNGEIFYGLKPDFIKGENTVIRPNVDVVKDVNEINEGRATVPDDIIYRKEISRLKLMKLLFAVPGVFVLLMAFLIARYNPQSGLVLLGISTVASVIYFLHIIPMLTKKLNQKIRRYTLESNQVEWMINGRVYGEHTNENSENVLYPKRGEGFYTLKPLEYLMLYTLQFQKGDVVKSDVLFENLRKALIANRTIKSNEKLSSTEKNKVLSIYQECANARVI